MNITALRPRFTRYIEPVAAFFSRAGFTANQVSFLALVFGILCAVLFSLGMFPAGSLALLVSALLDLVDGSIARQTSDPVAFSGRSSTGSWTSTWTPSLSPGSVSPVSRSHAFPLPSPDC